MDNVWKQAAPQLAYEKPELREITFKELLRGNDEEEWSCLGLPETGEGGCEEDLFTPEYGE